MIIGQTVPLKSKIEIEIPPDYINKPIEIAIFPVERMDKKKSAKGSIRSLQGVLSFDKDLKK